MFNNSKNDPSNSMYKFESPQINLPPPNNLICIPETNSIYTNRTKININSNGVFVCSNNPKDKSSGHQSSFESTTLRHRNFLVFVSTHHRIASEIPFDMTERNTTCIALSLNRKQPVSIHTFDDQRALGNYSSI